MSAIDTSPKLNEASTINSPRHVAVIMDGNNRWAKQRKLPSIAGHRAGLKAARNIVEACRDYNIEVLTLFAFSSENWRRPKDEVSALMELFLHALKRETKRLKKNKIRLKVIGDISAFSDTIQQHIRETEQITAEFSEFTLVIAANYGGQWDMQEACKRLASQVKQGELTVDEITTEQIDSNLSTAGIPVPDLCIRTSGVHRISNFLLWQLAYAELYFTDTLWPDFNKAAFHQALLDYSSRQRRFGQTSEQVEAAQCLNKE
ncbi:polyprenyl diphosphate synthase [Spartinivicinus poritis]|uniref:Ditrans,polycis-undecaprenyl-diphosphate synthase ((2E,6E)-farnesyl-diphosphate specific) n=1 Tax=Spartinivicinus poritis TaxID=2994640 RepID=A0ABT5U348_9GAMM|nr:polyprenyl diphosphate synthase [Spartinivicinus sp. A2-2]MDE1460396.1 polyprenyl diphosphate synthase [Spartinivicinus sp. A2-2]